MNLAECIPSVRLTKSPVPRTGPISVRVDPLLDEPARLCGIETCLEAVGAPWQKTLDDRPVVYYGSNPHVGRSAGIWIPSDPQSDWTRVPPNWTLIGRLPVPFRGSPPSRILDGNRLTFDIALAAHFWISLGSQAMTLVRDAHGRVPGDQNLLVRLGCVHEPPVLGYADFLRRCVDTICPGISFRSAWPESKRYAVCLTHDVDQPERTRRTARCVMNVLLGPHIQRRPAYYALREDVRARGILDTFLAGPTQRSEWDFARFVEFETAIGFQSAFYFSVVHRGEGHECDVSYDSSLRRYRSLARRLRCENFEVGLHAGYGTRDDRPPIEEQVGRFRERTDHAPAGVRFHYLRIDSGEPLQSLASCARAGLRYDASLGFNDRPGFHTGHSLPYRAAADVSAPRILELPMTLADMHLPRNDAEAATRIALDHMERVRQLGGLAVLNWHVGHWRSDPAWREAYVAVCRHLAEDSDAWVARPMDVAEWWSRRREDLRGQSKR